MSGEKSRKEFKEMIQKMEPVKNNAGLKTKCIPIVNIRMMTDEEWNRIAYRNYLERSKRHEKKRN